jgi:hypothetical protein
MCIVIAKEEPMRTDDHRRAVGGALLLSTGPLAVLGAMTEQALVGWLAALVTAVAGGGIMISLIQKR